jgi:hypothetical protein
MTREARYPDDPAEPFWWTTVACTGCGDREMALNVGGRIAGASAEFVCMFCGRPATLTEVAALAVLAERREATR